ncbi:LysR family transcriptional regulator [Allopusillimonas soli]|uniref:LysR family transcriptional regulator n=1 Tax=Allopusillimonas soli TaxID=659016 RepID=A0A853FDT4_9BURK|nr:LysR family transcriptional regulator [Allopusillimonas soli]NYT38233.1 LysR family transcriptional regulator [Allopusillimonas soli]TEA72188.1 LysR family transcriptional regulator [Allopusillimonas soli]
MLDWDGLRYFLEVARTQRVSTAGARLGVRHSTVSRRIQALERELDTLLFEKSKTTGYTLTEDGSRFLAYAEQIEGTLNSAREDIAGQSRTLSGHLRVGSTEGFGSYVLSPLMIDFQNRYPAITLDIMPVPRFISLSKREADIAIALERPQRGPYLCTKLLDYSLKLYGHRDYLARNQPIRTRGDLAHHAFIGYVDELVFSDHLRYLEDVVAHTRVIFRSTSVIAQYHAVLQGRSLAILPCFMAEQDARLQVVLEQDVAVTRSFWMYCHEDLRHSARVMTLWDFLKRAVQLNAPLLRGESGALRFLD